MALEINKKTKINFVSDPEGYDVARLFNLGKNENGDLKAKSKENYIILGDVLDSTFTPNGNTMTDVNKNILQKLEEKKKTLPQKQNLQKQNTKIPENLQEEKETQSEKLQEENETQYGGIELLGENPFGNTVGINPIFNGTSFTDNTTKIDKRIENIYHAKAYNIRNLLFAINNKNVFPILGNRDINKLKLVDLLKFKNLNTFEDMQYTKDNFVNLCEQLSNHNGEDLWEIKLLTDSNGYSPFWNDKRHTKRSEEGDYYWKTGENQTLDCLGRFNVIFGIDGLTGTMSANQLLYTIPLELIELGYITNDKKNWINQNIFKLDKPADFERFLAACVIMAFKYMLSDKKDNIKEGILINGLLKNYYSKANVCAYFELNNNLILLSHGGITNEFITKNGEIINNIKFTLYEDVVEVERKYVRQDGGILIRKQINKNNKDLNKTVLTYNNITLEIGRYNEFYKRKIHNIIYNSYENALKTKIKDIMNSSNSHEDKVENIRKLCQENNDDMFDIKIQKDAINNVIGSINNNYETILDKLIKAMDSKEFNKISYDLLFILATSAGYKYEKKGDVFFDATKHSPIIPGIKSTRTNNLLCENKTLFNIYGHAPYGIMPVIDKIEYNITTGDNQSTTNMSITNRSESGNTNKKQIIAYNVNVDNSNTLLGNMGRINLDTIEKNYYYLCMYYKKGKLLLCNNGKLYLNNLECEKYLIDKENKAEPAIKNEKVTENYKQITKLLNNLEMQSNINLLYDKYYETIDKIEGIGEYSFNGIIFNKSKNYKVYSFLEGFPSFALKLKLVELSDKDFFNSEIKDKTSDMKKNRRRGFSKLIPRFLNPRHKSKNITTLHKSQFGGKRYNTNKKNNKLKGNKTKKVKVKNNKLKGNKTKKLKGKSNKLKSNKLKSNKLKKNIKYVKTKKLININKY
jgi:hypothetical protein